MASIKFEIYDDQVLGVGSYGKVCKAKYGQLPCAAKLLHDTMFESGDPGIFKFAERFEQECQFLSMIKHPNIVQYLGTCRNPQSQRLALLMELMDESLTRLLERSTYRLPYHIQLNICHDVALALSYLHSNDVIHRDLSSNNVLLIGEGSRAKVTDFGMSKLMDMNPRMTPLTVCPGATVYMPPEALTTPPHYSSKLDCFSHGVLTIQILTKKFPKPGDAHRLVEDHNYPTGHTVMLIPETERRKADIDPVEPNHPLLPLALCCLRNRATERPSADEVCEKLATLKREERYTHSVEQTRGQASLIQTLRGELEQKEQVMQQERAHTRDQTSLIQALREKLVQKDHVMQEERASRDRETRDQVSVIHTLREELAQKDEILQQGNGDLVSLVHTLQEEIKEKEQLIFQEREYMKRERDEHEAELEQLQKSMQQEKFEQTQLIASQRNVISQKNEQIGSFLTQIAEKDSLIEEKVNHKKGSGKRKHYKRRRGKAAEGDLAEETPGVIASSWKEKEPSPEGFRCGRGTALVYGSTIYFSYDYQIYEFAVPVGKWNELPPCQYSSFGLAVINGMLTTIGGSGAIALLLSLKKELNDWTKVFPSMPTGRGSPAVVATRNHVVVAGGHSIYFDGKNSVEVLDTKTLLWSIANNLPQPVEFPKISLCSGHIYLSNHSTLFSCSVEELLKSCDSPMLASASSSKWKALADIPVKHFASLVTVNGHLLALGGMLDGGNRTGAIHWYNRGANSWCVVGQLPTPVSSVLATSLPNHEFMVVGGYASDYEVLCSACVFKVVK